MVHPSHYFDTIERYLRNVSGPKSFNALRQIVIEDGCPENIADQVVAGALVDYIFDIMPRVTDDIKIYGPDGVGIVEEKKLYSKDEWVSALLNTIMGMNKSYAENILDYMLQKQYLVERNDTTGTHVYRNMAPVRRTSVEII